MGDVREVGILGDGQLARMLAEAAVGLGLSPVVYAASATAPASLVAPRHVIGTLRDAEPLRAFFRSVEAVVFENEFVDTRVLADAAGDEASTLFRPPLETIATLQDKMSQKRVLAASGAAIPRWIAQERNEPDSAFVERVLAELGGRAVLKWARLGYDGRGVLAIADSAEDWVRAEEFCRRAAHAGVPLFAEEFVPFRQELAMVASRSTSGDCVTYPLVISEQERGICREVRGPAVALGVAPALEEEAARILRALGEEASLAGTYAIEFFEADDGRLLANEVAPRVHNTGHYSLDACDVSQFENHWRGVLDLPLRAPHCRAGFAMVNILGPEGVKRTNGETPPPQSRPNARVYWYEKDQIVPWRKLGHVNGAADDPADVPDVVRELRALDDEWCTMVRGEGGTE